MEEKEKGSMVAGEAVVRRLAEAVEEIAAISEYRNAYRKPLCSLARRIRLLAPMFDELGDGRDPITEPVARTLAPLEDAFAAAKDLLRLGSEGSKIFLVCWFDNFLRTIALPFYPTRTCVRFLHFWPRGL